MRRALLTLTLIPVAAVLGACGSSSSSEQGQQPARVVHLGRNNVPSIALSPLGMKRIGIKTAQVSELPSVAPAPKPTIRFVRVHGVLRRHVIQPPAPSRTGPVATIPYSALVYESDGTPVVYTQSSPGVYTKSMLSVSYISGNNVFVNAGPRPGSKVVTVGAAELLGVENGVGAT